MGFIFKNNNHVSRINRISFFFFQIKKKWRTGLHSGITSWIWTYYELICILSVLFFWSLYSLQHNVQFQTLFESPTWNNCDFNNHYMNIEYNVVDTQNIISNNIINRKSNSGSKFIHPSIFYKQICHNLFSLCT